MREPMRVDEAYYINHNTDYSKFADAVMDVGPAPCTFHNCPKINECKTEEKECFNKVPGFSFEDVQKWGISQIPMKRFGQPEEVAKAVLWLFSDESSYLTGHSLIIDGGIHCK